MGLVSPSSYRLRKKGNLLGLLTKLNVKNDHHLYPCLYREVLTRLISLCHEPFTQTIESPSFVTLFKCTKPELKMVGVRSVSLWQVTTDSLDPLRDKTQSRSVASKSPARSQRPPLSTYLVPTLEVQTLGMGHDRPLKGSSNWWELPGRLGTTLLRNVQSFLSPVHPREERLEWCGQLHWYSFLVPSSWSTKGLRLPSKWLWESLSKDVGF